MAGGPNNRPVLIVGLQKSGTSLLLRLLQDTGIAVNPFRGEGDSFWGNTPPFAPTAFPAGALYQRRGGELGHTLEAADATPEVRAALRERLPRAHATIVNKNPYNVVRVPWLRAVLPEALIVAVVRAAVPTSYSLTKKYTPHEQRGQAPDEGWWGVKPAGWRHLRDDDKLVQSARQWAAVTERLLETATGVDLVVPYPRLCAEPAAVLREIARHATGEAPRLDVAPVRCFDDEYRRGSRLRSKNRYYHELGSLETPASEPIDLPPLDGAQVEIVRGITSETEERLRQLADAKR